MKKYVLYFLLIFFSNLGFSQSDVKVALSVPQILNSHKRIMRHQNLS
jgi:hypothetical protein